MAINKRLIKSNDEGGSINPADFFGDGSAIRYYPFDGTKIDETGTLNPVSSSNTFGTGRYGQALFLGGSTTITSNSLSYGTTLTEINSFSTPFTVSVWVKHTAQKRNIIWNTSRSSLGSNGFELTADNKVQFGTNNVFLTTGTYPINNWINIVSVWNGTNCIGYVNSAYIGSASQGAVGNVYDYFGYWSSNIGLYGYIDNVRVFNRVINQSEVNQLYAEPTYS